MYRGKHICNQLKAVRRRIAEENDIPLEIKECTHDGPCRGTCPRCEAEVRYLENALAGRLRMGKVATVAGLSLSLAACGNGAPSAETAALPQVTTDERVEVPDTMTPPLPSPEKDEIPLETGDLEVIQGEAIPPEIVTGDACEALPTWEGEIVDDNDNDIFTVVDEDPEFPGGIDSLYTWIQARIKYPTLARENNISGKVYVSFVVETDGSISNPRLLRDIGGGCGAEAIRVVRQIPRWKPGKNKGVPVRVQFNLPINFTLSDDAPAAAFKVATIRPDDEEEMILGMIVDPEPEFPGGIEALYKFLAENIKYPAEAKEQRIQGKVYVNFTIDVDGTVKDARVLRDIGGGCGEEALRVVNMMPKWIPATRQGTPLPVSYNLPITFTLKDE